ncbi:MAG: hypothetical protein A2309_01775, partial [Bacteroidetes bacterium RIFOXYB2_FULL_35_7]
MGKPSKIYILKSILFFILMKIAASGFSQTVTGTTKDETDAPLPFVTVYIKETRFGTLSNKDGIYYLMLNEGTYTATYQCLGYGTIEKKIQVKKGLNTFDVILSLKPYQIPAVTVSSSNEDKAYPIIRKAIGMASYYRNQIQEFSSEVYMKGTLKVNKISWAVKVATRNEKNMVKEGSLYVQESLNNIQFTAPDKYEQHVKMIRSNFPSGESENNDVMEFVNASLYQPKIGDIILPLAPYAMKHYKYRYAGYTKQGDRIVNKIRVIPKRKSKQLVEGYIYISDNYWNIHSADLTAQTVIGSIQVKQTFGEVEKNIWLPISYNFDINGKFIGNEGIFNYVSSVKYKFIILNTKIAPPSNLTDAFNAAQKEEIKATKTKTEKDKTPAQLKKEQKRKEQIEELMQKEELSNREMHKLSELMEKNARQARDTSRIKNLEIKRSHKVNVDSSARIIDTARWNIIRPVALTSEEVKIIDQNNEKESEDSLERKSSFASTLIFGKYWNNKEKKRAIAFSGLLSMEQFRFNTVDGFVLGASCFFRKNFGNTDIRLYPLLSYAIDREKLMINMKYRFSYAPMKRGFVGGVFGSESIDFGGKTGVGVFGNTLASLFYRLNYIKLYEHQFVELNHQIDIVNGLVFRADAGYYQRSFLRNFSDFAFIKYDDREYTINAPPVDSSILNKLQPHNTTLASLALSYTPEHFYQIRDDRKYMLSSRFPT